MLRKTYSRTEGFKRYSTDGATVFSRRKRSRAVASDVYNVYIENKATLATFDQARATVAYKHTCIFRQFSVYPILEIRFASESSCRYLEAWIQHVPAGPALRRVRSTKTFY